MLKNSCDSKKHRKTYYILSYDIYIEPSIKSYVYL